MTQVRAQTEIEKAERRGHRVYRDPGQYVVDHPAPIAKYGRVRYFLLRAGWVCDECGARVTVEKFHSHAMQCSG